MTGTFYPLLALAATTGAYVGKRKGLVWGAVVGLAVAFAADKLLSPQGIVLFGAPGSADPGVAEGIAVG